MIATVQDIAAAVRAAASNYPSLQRIVLFGSFARGEQTDGSDVDIVAQFDAKGPYTERLDLYSDLEHRLGRPVDMVTSLSGAPKYFVNAILRDGIKLYERI